MVELFLFLHWNKITNSRGSVLWENILIRFISHTNELNLSIYYYDICKACVRQLWKWNGWNKIGLFLCININIYYGSDISHLKNVVVRCTIGNQNHFNQIKRYSSSTAAAVIEIHLKINLNHQKSMQMTKEILSFLSIVPTGVSHKNKKPKWKMKWITHNMFSLYSSNCVNYPMTNDIPFEPLNCFWQSNWFSLSEG